MAMDIADFTANANKAARHVERFNERLTTAARGLVALATTGTFAYLAKTTIAATARLDDLAESTSLAVETMSSLERTAFVGGRQMQDLVMPTATLARAMAEAAGGNQKFLMSFKALGFTQEQLKRSKFDDIYVEFAKKISNAENPTNALGHAIMLAGRHAHGAMPFWKDLAETGLEHALITAQQAAEAERLEKETRRAMLAFRDAKDEVVIGMIPALTSLAQQFNAARDAAEGAVGAVTNFFRISGKQAADPAAALAEVEARLAKLRADQAVLAGPSLGAKFNRMMAPEDLEILAHQIDFAEKQQRTLESLLKRQRARAASDSSSPFFEFGGGGMTQVPPPMDDAILKRQISAIQQMEEKKKSLFNLNEQEIALERIRAGTWRDFDSDAKVRLLNLALEIDLRKQLVDRIETEARNVEVLRQRFDDAGDAQRDYIMGTVAAVDQARFEVNLIGKVSAEVERLNALRAIDLDLLSRKRDMSARFGDDVAGAQAETRRLDAEAARRRDLLMPIIAGSQQQRRNDMILQSIDLIQHETVALTMSRREQQKVLAIRVIEAQQFGRVLSAQERSVMLTEEDIKARERLIAAIERQQQVERSWVTGAVTALQNYADEATNAARNVEMVFSNAFRGMEDLIVDMAMTGKASFKDFANSVIADIGRMVVRQKITGPAANVIGSVIGNMFGGGGGANFGSAGAGDVMAVTNVGTAAHGGRIRGPTLVGERGPEIFNPDAGGSITPNHMLDKIGGGDMNINITVQALDPRTAAQVIAANAQTIISVFRREANRRGSKTAFG
ncbi:MAG: hypothetical protein A3G81_22470 [Betaproteobacteria bacterium RIFCSPLOWO2_12_FULL_65_14]|nr:MAG: hypothetical protein A3G81_22470 [Betaproteobacteria bacterium RIFCSPLOWO2_12_FULL_65_14]